MKISWHLLTVATLILSPMATVFAQDAAAKAKAAGDAAPAAGASAADELALQQGRLADKYSRLEELMLKMASLESATNPRRAALLTRAVEQSKERLTKTQLEAVVKMLNQQQLKRAVDGQATVQTDLKSLLDLLMSEDRSDRLKNEQARIKEYIKEVERLIRLQKGLEGQNQAGSDAERLAKDQQQLAGRTGDLAQKIKETEEGGEPKPAGADEEGADNEKPPEDGDDQSGEKKPDDAKPSDGKPNEGKPSEGKPSEEEQKPSEGGDKPSDESGKPTDPSDNKSDQAKPEDANKKPGDESKPGDPESGEEKPSDKPSEENKPGESGEEKPMEGSDSKPGSQKSKPGKPSESKPTPGQEGKPSDSDSQSQQSDQQQAEENPARKRIEDAQQKMQDAQKKLAEAKRKESVEDQRAAREELEKAKAELEEILRQMREEEVKRTLAALEQRFKKMLEMQLKVYESTRRLDQLPETNRGDQFVVEAGKLGFDERKIATEAFKALTLLQEEGSSVAFPASVEQMHEDMQQAAQRLGDTKIDDITIGIEEDIIAALEEMIDALQKAQQDLEDKQQQQQQKPQQGEQQEQPLVDQIAELKMIKALQLRVNKRTTRYARLLEDQEDVVGQASGSDLVEALQKLSSRQQEIFQITRDIVLGKNK
jgi:hypothetical protein